MTHPIQTAIIAAAEHAKAARDRPWWVECLWQKWKWCYYPNCSCKDLTDG